MRTGIGAYHHFFPANQQPPTTEELRAAVEVEQETLFWGKPYRVTPRLVDKVFGDGRQLIHLTPLSTRPNYYVVRIDSRWTIDEPSECDATIRDHLDDIIDAAAEQFGSNECDCEASAEDGHDDACPGEAWFPVFRSPDLGVAWGRLAWSGGDG
jgi:hypothetical protein